MSEFGGSIRSSRRSSITSRISVVTLPPLNVQSVRNFTRSTWFDSFIFFTTGLPEHEFIDNGLYIDVLKCLCDEKLSDAAILHLLTLLEHFAHLFTESDRLEQVVGSLLNLITTRQLKSDLKQKYLSTCCTLLLTNYELVKKNEEIWIMLDNLVEFLVVIVEKNENSLLVTGCNECLIQIESSFSDFLRSTYEQGRLSKAQAPLLAFLMNHQFLNHEDTVQLLSQLVLLSQKSEIQFYRSLSTLYTCLDQQNQSQTTTLSPLLFKPFLHLLTYTTEVQQFHLCLQLLRGFELVFTSQSEVALLQQLICACTHPALVVAHRLLLLDYVRDLLPVIKRNKLLQDVKSLRIQPTFDGPDTQEKKLLILTHGFLSDDELLFCLKPLKQLSLLRNNSRASNAFYRTLNRMISARPSMISTIEYLLLSMILKSPQQHIARTLSLLRLWPNLSENVLRLIIQETINHSDNFRDEMDLKAYLQAFEWILRKVDFQISEKDTLAILTFMQKKGQNCLSLHPYLVCCCSSVVRNQFLTESIKSRLIELLTLLSENAHLSLELSSWVQIFLIAIHSLPKEENFKEIFNDDLGLEAVHMQQANHPDDLPLRIQWSPPSINELAVQINDIQKELGLRFPIQFELSIDPAWIDRCSELYAIEFGIQCPTQLISECTQVDFLAVNQSAKVSFLLALKNLQPFELIVTVRCVNAGGEVFFCCNQIQSIRLIDIMLPTSLTFNEFQHLWHELLHDHSKICQWNRHTVCLQKVQTIAQLIQQKNWLSKFTIRNDNIAIAMSTDTVLLGKFLQLNNAVHLKLVTNNSKVLEPFQSEFADLL